MNTAKKLLLMMGGGQSAQYPLVANLRTADSLAYFACPDDTLLNFVDGTTDLAWTAVFAVYPRVSGVTCMLAARANGSNATPCWFVAINTSGQVLVRTLDDSTNIYLQCLTDGALAINELHHIVACYDGSGLNTGIKIFVDGDEVAVTRSANGTYVNSNNYGVINIGRNNIASPSYGNGYNLQTGFFKGIAFTEAQAAEAYNGGVRKSLTLHSQVSFLSAEYNFQDLTDSSGNGLTLTATNALIQPRYVESSPVIVTPDDSAEANTGIHYDPINDEIVVAKWGGLAGINKLIYYDRATLTINDESASLTAVAKSIQSVVYVPSLDAYLVSGVHLFERDGTFIRTYTLPVGTSLTDAGADFRDGFLWFIDAASPGTVRKCTIDESTIALDDSISVTGSDSSGLHVDSDGYWRWASTNKLRKFATDGTTLLEEIFSTGALSSGTEGNTGDNSGNMYVNRDDWFHNSTPDGNKIWKYAKVTDNNSY